LTVGMYEFFQRLPVPLVVCKDDPDKTIPGMFRVSS
jgi:hypothetical protein